MEIPVKSRFTIFYYVKIVVLFIIQIVFISCLIYFYLHSPKYHEPTNIFVILLVCSLSILIYILFLVKTYKRITVTAEYVLVENLNGTKLIAHYDEFASVGTYRANPNTRSMTGEILYQQLYIELNNGKSINLYGGHYNNYTQLKWAIYDNMGKPSKQLS